MARPSPHLHLLYHEIRELPSVYSYVVLNSVFESHLDAMVEARQNGPPLLWPEITFDDGHLSNFDLALPALQKRSLAAHFFITVGWTGTRAGYMGWTELRALHAAGQTIGAHGWSHTLLTHCDRSALEMELQTARLTLEDKLGTSITTMSLPGGRFNQRVLASIHDAGYTRIYTSIPRSEANAEAPLIGRLNVRNDADAAWIRQLLNPSSGVLANLEKQDRWKSTLKRAMGDRLYARLWGLLNRQEPEAEPDGVSAR